MSIVLDANALVVLALDQRRASTVEQLLRAWADEGEVLHAPDLLPYEVANALSRAVTAGQLLPAEAPGGATRTGGFSKIPA